MTTLIHPVSPEEIMALLDGELCAAEQQSLQKHIAECTECSQLEEQYRRFLQQLQSWTIETVPPSVEAKIQSQFAGTFTAASTNVQKNNAAKRRIWHPAWIVSGGVAAVILVLLFTVPWRYERQMAFSESRHQAAVAAQRNQFNSLNQTSSGDEFKLRGYASGLADPHPLASSVRAVASVAKDPLQPASAPLIARTVSLSIVVRNFTLSRNALDALLTRHHGYAAQLTATTPDNASRSFQASLRVPAAELPAALADFKSLGRVENETQSGEEVTQQHADLLARLKNARETENRLQAILQQHTGKIEDILAVEQEIARVRGEIETMEVDQQNLEHRVDFATINLQLNEEYQAHVDTGSSPSIGAQLRNALVSGYRHARDLVIDILLFAAEAGPTLLILLAILGIPAFYLVRRYRRIRYHLD